MKHRVFHIVVACSFYSRNSVSALQDVLKTLIPFKVLLRRLGKINDGRKIILLLAPSVAWFVRLSVRMSVALVYTGQPSCWTEWNANF